MSTAFISDLHLTPDRPDIADRFRRFVDSEAHRLRNLFVLGDLFEYWIGDDAADYTGQEVVLESFRDLAAAGVMVNVMHGNRDFLLGDTFARAAQCRLIPDPTPSHFAGVPGLLMHGDSLCTDDIEHQRFRAIVRDPGWRRQFLLLPVAERDRMARNLRYRSELGKRYRPLEIMDVNPAAVAAAMRDAGASILIHGHTHRPAVHPVLVGQRPGWRIVLGDWYEQSSILRFDGAEFALTPGNHRLAISDAQPPPGTQE